jgi:succinate dehydrogenase/fumarate reductase flavoprotein subunit
MQQQHFDVIVVGAGGSGLAAACSAAEHGGRVLVLEKRPQPGGTTGIAVGSFTAARTSLQRDANIDDDPQAHAEDAAKFAAAEIEARNNDPLRAYFLCASAATLDWLRTLGVSFVGPNPEPPNRVPRMHNVVPGAKAYIAALQLALQRAGGQLICDASVDELLRDHQGRVTGVRASIAGESQEFLAARGVILAAGDYANNATMIAAHKGERFQLIEGINPFTTGDGHRLAEQAGAKLVNMDVTYGPELRFVPSSKRPFQQWLPAGGVWSRVMGAVARRLPKWVMRAMIKRLLVTWQHPENSLFDDGAILVNKLGQRFVNETLWPDREIGVAAQPDKIAYILLDGRLAERYSAWPHFISTAPDIAYAYVQDYKRLRPDVTAAGESLREVATRRGLDSASLQQTIDEFNQYATGGAPDRFGRTGDQQPLQNAPWVLLGPLKSYFTTTEGGAAINERLQVLDSRGAAIPGLYAVGQNGLGGMILWGHGLHIAWAMTSGRLAGRFVMECDGRDE